MFRQHLLTLIVDFLKDNGLSLLYKALGAFGIFSAGYLAIHAVVKRVKKRVREQSLDEESIYTHKMANMLGSITFTSLMIFNFFAVLGFLGLDVALVVGALSIAIGFALETTIKNMISGIFLLTNKKNKLGDTVEILGKFQLRGKIEAITLRHTTIRTVTKQRVIIPNGELADTPIKTYKNEKVMKGSLHLVLPRYVNLEQVKQLIIQSINQHDFVIHQSYTSTIVSGFDAHGIQLQCFYYLDPKAGKSEFIINSDIRKKLSQVFQHYGIKPPYLHVVIDVA